MFVVVIVFVGVVVKVGDGVIEEEAVDREVIDAVIVAVADRLGVPVFVPETELV